MFFSSIYCSKKLHTLSLVWNRLLKTSEPPVLFIRQTPNCCLCLCEYEECSPQDICIIHEQDCAEAAESGRVGAPAAPQINPKIDVSNEEEIIGVCLDQLAFSPLRLACCHCYLMRTLFRGSASQCQCHNTSRIIDEVVIIKSLFYHSFHYGYVVCYLYYLVLHMGQT